MFPRSRACLSSQRCYSHGLGGGGHWKQHQSQLRWLSCRWVESVDETEYACQDPHQTSKDEPRARRHRYSYHNSTFDILSWETITAEPNKLGLILHESGIGIENLQASASNINMKPLDTVTKYNRNVCKIDPLLGDGFWAPACISDSAQAASHRGHKNVLDSHGNWVSIPN